MRNHNVAWENWNIKNISAPFEFNKKVKKLHKKIDEKNVNDIAFQS